MSEEKTEKKEKARKPKPEVKADDKGEDFVHLVRLSGVVVDGNLTISKSLMKIKGIGPRLAVSIMESLELPPEIQVGTLNEGQIADIEAKLEDIKSLVPAWMVNRRKDSETGDNLHKIGPELDMQNREDINLQKKIKSYRGIRHQLNLPVRGQRTRSTGRKGTTIGVSRKKAPAKAQAKT